MSLPISWVVAGAIPASQALKQTANLASTSASHFFGEFLQKNPAKSSLQAADNGRSEQTEATTKSKSNSDATSIADRIESLRTTLSKFVNDTRSKYGLKSVSNKSDAMSISTNGVGTPVIAGPEPMRTELENHLHENPSVLQEINAIASKKSNEGPLRLMPQADQLGTANEPWTLWLEPQ